MGSKILLVEDDSSLNRAVSLKLQKENYEVSSAFSVSQARTFLSDDEYELIICDIGLPDGSGLDFCAEVRKTSEVMFLFLTAMDSEVDMINGYEAGADDYMTKPFSLTVMISKVNAVMRRSIANKNGKRPGDNDSVSIRSGNIELMLDEKRVLKSGEYLQLTANEYKLLLYFMTNPMKILSKTQLLEAVWDIDGNFVDDNTLAVNIRRLREKIEDEPSQPDAIKNVRGLGYIWERKCETN